MTDDFEGIDETNEWLRSSPDHRKHKMIAYDWANGVVAPFLPTSFEIVEQALKEAQINSTTTFLDIGCGDGRFVLAAAKLGAKLSVGYEIDDGLLETCNSLKETLLVKFEKRDLSLLTESDFDQFSVVVAFLFPEVVTKLSKHLQNWLLKDSNRKLLCIRWPIPILSHFLTKQGHNGSFFLYQHLPHNSKRNCDFIAL